MENQIKNCKNCGNNFTVEAADFAFYAKLDVPPPTLCRECRQMRRMSFRNERTLYKRKSDKSGKDIISIFPPESPFKVYEHDYWYDQFNPMDYGRDFNFSRSFFEQFKEFMLDIPWPSLRIEGSENSEYNNDVGKSKDLYLCARTHSCANVLYSYRANASRDCVDCMQVFKSSEFLYECVECITCTNSNYLYFSENCANSSMLWNCKNCVDCFMCSNLRNKQYCIKNVEVGREEYNKKMAEYNSASFIEKENKLREFEFLHVGAIRKNLNIINSVNSTGDNIFNSKNTYLSFSTKHTENVRYLWDIGYYKDSMDCYSGGRGSELIYECTATSASYNCKSSIRAFESSDISYSIFVQNSKNLFGCIGLQNKEYCILNKQYTKEKYEALVTKIIAHMQRTGEYGEFFPMELSMHAYNETVAQEYFPLSKKEAVAKGLHWRDPDTKNYKISISAENLPDSLDEIEEGILNETIGCAHEGSCLHGCTTAFRMIPRELEFYKRMKLPLPRLCPNCRHYGRLAKLNPQKLWSGKCQCAGMESDNGVYQNLAKHHLHNDDHCPNEFETSYAPDRREIVYCEKCYQQEMY